MHLSCIFMAEALASGTNSFIFLHGTSAVFLHHNIFYTECMYFVASIQDHTCLHTIYQPERNLGYRNLILSLTLIGNTYSNLFPKGINLTDEQCAIKCKYVGLYVEENDLVMTMSFVFFKFRLLLELAYLC